ncbi:hypothetical protein ACFU5O_24745 [Streptomyces sp. NPDC057445]|uniref:phosphoketolase family protein n=1 Tax=Streptomyces sp. NPDC057445 TaxID=3346136 RepID=UPI003677CCF8
MTRHGSGTAAAVRVTAPVLRSTRARPASLRRDPRALFAHHRAGHPNLHVRGSTEHGTTTTPFDMAVSSYRYRYRLTVSRPPHVS